MGGLGVESTRVLWVRGGVQRFPCGGRGGGGGEGTESRGVLDVREFSPGEHV